MPRDPFAGTPIEMTEPERPESVYDRLLRLRTTLIEEAPPVEVEEEAPREWSPLPPREENDDWRRLTSETDMRFEIPSRATWAWIATTGEVRPWMEPLFVHLARMMVNGRVPCPLYPDGDHSASFSENVTVPINRD